MGIFKKKDNVDNFDDYYDNQGFFVGPQGKLNQNQNNNYYYDDYNNNLSNDSNPEKKQSISIVILTLVFAYMLFLILGMVNTTFEKGYVPQIINVEIRAQRAVYDKIEPMITFVSEADTFNGMPELSKPLTSEFVSSRIVQLKLLSKEIESFKSDLEKTTVKVKDDDPMKLEMLQITSYVLNSVSELNTAAISYYETITGYSSMEDPAVIQMQTNILNMYNTHQNKMMDANNRIEQIKKYVLLIN